MTLHTHQTPQTPQTPLTPQTPQTPQTLQTLSIQTPEPMPQELLPQPPTTAGWRGELKLHYTSVAGRTRARDVHQGPLRVLQALYPEGPGICHHVVLHPPGGIVGGDELHLHADLAEGAHALITTPGATRFYRSGGRVATQSATLRLAAGARLEWLPLETIAYPGCEALNRVTATLAPGAEMMGWDVLALGLPSSSKDFQTSAAAPGGWFQQHLELPGIWLERGRIAAADELLLKSPLGWAGHRVLASLWFAAGESLTTGQRDNLLDAARTLAQAHPLARTAGATSPQSRVLLLRVLAPGVEPALALLRQVRAAWRRSAWGLPAEAPRVWQS